MCVLVVGLGNSLRGDDGAGIVAAQRLAAAWEAAGQTHRLLLTHQLVPEIAEDLAQPEVEMVLFVDTAVGTSTAGAFALRLAGGGLLQGVEPSEAESENDSMTHHVSPQLLLAYAHVLYERTPAGWLLTVPGHSFEFGAQFSTVTTQAIDAVERQAAEVWRVIHAVPAISD